MNNLTMSSTPMSRRTTFARVIRYRGIVIGGTVLMLILIAVILGPLFSPYDYKSIETSRRLEMPTLEHPFGTDNFGRDLLTRVLVGGRYSLSIGLGAVLIAFCLAMVVGTICTYLGGWWDAIAMRITDALIAFPTLLLSLVFVAIFGNNIAWVVVAVGLGVFPRMTRLVRGTVIEKRDLDFIEAAKALGANNFRIICRHILPNVLAPILVSLSFETSTAIVIEASLGFLGLGVQPPTPTWGSIVSEGRKFLWVNPYPVIFSALAISLTLLALNILGDALRDYLDPRLRHEQK